MNEINTTMFLPICDKTVTAEAGCEFSMPDYQPEIRRLLRVNATLLPPTSYVGAGKAEFVGAVRYDMLYSAADGGLRAEQQRGHGHPAGDGRPRRPGLPLRQLRRTRQLPCSR